MTPAVRAGYLAPYNSWSNRVAVNRFVKDIPRAPRHPSYETLLQMEQGLPTLGRSSLVIIVGDARLVVFISGICNASSISFPPPKFTACPTPATGSWKTPPIK